MQDIIALKTEDEFTSGSNHSMPSPEHSSKNIKIHPNRTFCIDIQNDEFKIDFKRNFTPYKAYITINNDGTFTFKTAEKTASWAGDTTEQRTASKGYFRDLDPNEIKNKYALLKLETEHETGEPIKNVKDLIKQAQKWNQKYGANIEITEDPVIMKQRLLKFIDLYNKDIIKQKNQAIISGEKKYVSTKQTDFPVIINFEKLENCLRWVWAYFIARKTTRTKDPKQAFYYIMNHKELWYKHMPLQSILNQVD